MNLSYRVVRGFARWNLQRISEMMTIQHRVMLDPLGNLFTQTVEFNLHEQKSSPDQDSNLDLPVLSSRAYTTSAFYKPVKASIRSEDTREYVPALGSDPDKFGDLHGLTETFEHVPEDQDDLKFQEQDMVADKLRTKEYADLIKKFIKERKLAEAIDVLETRMLKVDNVKPEYYLYNLLIGECGRVGYTKKAFHLYNQMKKRSLHVSAAIYTALFNSCANSPFPQKALKQAAHLYELMQEKGYQPNKINYHAMIKAFGRCGDLSTAFSLVDKMVDQGLSLTDDTFNFLLQACIADKEAGFRHALMVWRKLMSRHVKPTSYSFNLLLRCTKECGLGDPDVARDLLQPFVVESRLKREDAPVTTSIRSVVADEESSSLVETRPNLLGHYPCLGSNLLPLAEVNTPENRLLLLGGPSGFLQAMKEMWVDPDIKTFTQLLHLIPPTLAAEKSLLEALSRLGVDVDIDFFNMLIKKRSMRGDYKNGRQVLQLIREAKLYPDIVTFGVLALGCRTKEEAQALLRDMKEASFRVENHLGTPPAPVHLTEIRTLISPSSAVEQLNTTNAVNDVILGTLLRQATYHSHFGYVLLILETARREEVTPGPQFMEHLRKFEERAWEKLKQDDKHHSAEEAEKKDTFRKIFRMYRLRCKQWEEQVKPRTKVEHPWEQFGAKRDRKQQKQAVDL
uniref:(California timema) hypothetical protein n=1 Tax=Timema californicum TaxID=61474 RepID=A0A7R9PCA9_TIMCA|nr:unnamed protein product [Timema californicum]